MTNKTHEFRLMMEPGWMKEYKEFCESKGYTMSGFARAAINKRLADERFIISQTKKASTEALNGSESVVKSGDVNNDKNGENQ